MPFIIIALAIAFVMVYKAGKAGAKRSPGIVSVGLLREADKIFVDLLHIDDIETDDILTPKTRTNIQQWQTKYERVKNA